MDLVTVTCSRDKNLMLMQSYSINKFVETPTTHWVVIEDFKTSKDEWYDLLEPYYTKHTLKIITNLLPEKYYTKLAEEVLQIKQFNYNAGWRRHALLKLLIANNINTEYFLWLDSKNFFISPTNLNVWPPVDEGNNIVDPIENFSEPWIRWVEKKYNFKRTDSVWNSHMPFKVNTKTVKKIIDLDVVELVWDFLTDPNISDHNNWTSEVALYSIFIQQEGRQLTSGKTLNYTMWSDIPDKEFLKDVRSWPSVKTLGLHSKILRDESKFDKLKIFSQFLIELEFDSSIVNFCLMDKEL